MPGTIGSGGNVLYSWMIAPSLTPVSVAQNTAVEQSFSIPGLQPFDYVDVYSVAQQTTGIGIINCRVSSAGVLQIGFSNSTGGALTPVAGLYLMCICRPESLPLPLTAA